MTYPVGVAMIVAGLMLLEFGRRYHKTAAANSVGDSFFAGEFMALSITILLSGGLTTLLADPLTRLDLASTAYFVLSLAGIAVIFLAYLRIGRARRRAQPATPLAPA